MQRFLCKVWARVCVIYTFHYESGTIYHSLFNQRKQIMTLCLHFWSVINLKQGIAALRKMISYWTALQTSAGVFLFSFSFYCVCYFLSLSLNSPQHEIFPPQAFVFALQLSRKRSCVSISELHSHVHRALAIHDTSCQSMKNLPFSNILATIMPPVSAWSSYWIKLNRSLRQALAKQIQLFP